MKPRLFWSVLSIETRKLMSYRADFWLNAVVSFFVQMAVAYYLWLAIFEATGQREIGGFTFDGMVVYYVLAILLGNVVRGQERRVALSRDIYEGSLTRYLIYPSSYFGFKYGEHLGALLPATVQLVLFGSLAALVIDPPGGIELTLQGAAMAAVSVMLANLLFFLLLYPIQGIAFWADNVWSLIVMARFGSELLGGFMLPLTLFPPAAQRLLELLPFEYLFYFPVMVASGRVAPEAWLRGGAVALAWCAILGLVGRRVWRRGYLTYTGVGI